MSDQAERPPTPEDIRLYRIELLERAHAELRLELHDEYLDRAQLMNEYIPRAEHLRLITEKQQEGSARLNRLMAAAALVMTFSSVASIVVAVVHG